MSETGTPLLSETIQLNVHVPAENSLKGLLTQLDQVKAKIIEANEALAGITTSRAVINPRRLASWNRPTKCSG